MSGDVGRGGEGGGRRSELPEDDVNDFGGHESEGREGRGREGRRKGREMVDGREERSAVGPVDERVDLYLF